MIFFHYIHISVRKIKKTSLSDLFISGSEPDVNYMSVMDPETLWLSTGTNRRNLYKKILRICFRKLGQSPRHPDSTRKSGIRIPVFTCECSPLMPPSFLRTVVGSRSEAEFMNVLVQFCWGFGHNLESSQTRGFRIQCLHYKLISNHFCSKGGDDCE